MAQNSAIIDIEERPDGRLEHVTTVLTVDAEANTVERCFEDIERLPDLFPYLLRITEMPSEKGKRIVELVIRYQFYLVSCSIEVLCTLETDGKSFAIFRGLRGNVENFMFRLQVKEKNKRLLLYVSFNFDLNGIGPLISAQLQSYPELEVAMLSTFSLGFAKSFKRAVERQQSRA